MRGILARNIDHGKTSLLDRIRGTVVTAKEAGGITQHIGATEVPIDAVKKICGPLILKLQQTVTIPGLLFIDTPGHAAFNNLRKRGGSISDIGILVVDVTEGFKPQTVEALNILKNDKTPFLVVANKIDKLHGWQTHLDAPLMKSISAQRDSVQQTLDTKIYEIVESLYRQGFSADRFDRVSDFTREIAVVPLSAETGEGLPEVLMALTGLTQKYLEEQLKIDVSGPGKGSILEIKQAEGLGTTLDVILYDGTVKKGDTIIVGTRDEPIQTTVKALLQPKPMQEIRIGSNFDNIEEVHAAAGLKITAPNLEDALPGAPVYVVPEGTDAEEVIAQVRKEVQSVQIETETTGVVVKADTLGTLEALVKMLQEDGIRVRKAGFGPISKKDLMEAEAVRKEEPLKGVVFGFNVKPLPDVEKEAKSLGVNLFVGEVVYALIDEYKAWVEEQQNMTKEEILETMPRPAKLHVLKGCMFRQSKPAVVGVEVLGGTIKPGYQLINNNGVKVGEVKTVQLEAETIKEATTGMKVAISIPGAIVGKHLKEEDTLYVKLSGREINTLRTKLKDLLSPMDLALLRETEELVK